jgi:hypothetical protein
MNIGDLFRKLRAQPTSGEMIQRLEDAAKTLGADPNSWRDPAAAREHADRAHDPKYLAALAEAISAEGELDRAARGLPEPQQGHGLRGSGAGKSSFWKR